MTSITFKNFCAMGAKSVLAYTHIFKYWFKGKLVCHLTEPFTDDISRICSSKIVSLEILLTK